MLRTTVMLPQKLKLQAIKYAQKQGVSLGELIRESLESQLKERYKTMQSKDPFFQDKDVYNDKTPDDLAINHDHYLDGK